MQKSKMNIVVFDQNQSVLTDQSRANYSTTRRPTASNTSISNQPQSLTISNQLTSLNQKISFLQQKAQKIQQMIKQSQNSNALCQANTSMNTTSVNSIQIEELLKVVERKIQIVVNETKKIIEKMTEQFDRKLGKCVSQKQHETNSITKIQNHCRDTITKIQQSYQQQANRIKNQHLNLQKKLIQRVQILENDYKRKLKDFQSKQQQYVATIDHLENKLKAINKSKKMIQVTQQRPSTIRTQNSDNMSNLSSQHVNPISSSNNLPAHDTSKRRTKIFQSNRSVSPNNPNSQVLSPLKTQNNVKKQVQNVKEPKLQEKNFNKNRQVTPPLANNYISEQRQQAPQSYPLMQIKATVIPPNQQQQLIPPKLPVQNYLSNPQPNNSTKQKQLQQASSKEFLKDAPKVHWQRFQDFNEDDNQDSDQDVFFYPQRTKDEPKSVFQYDHNNSMQSPFDFN